MKLKGTDFAKAHMETKGWTSGEGLGRHGQGITDAIKPKLKFDQCGMGHNRADEFEFHWWDHVFNKAAKSVKVDESEGEVKVDFNSDKSELSTKKIRKKAQKEMKQKLYSNFVKSGTMTDGKFKEEDSKEIGNNFVEDKDLSKIRTLTDEELVKACGGRTAHKGSRHGHKMNAKLLRIEQAEKEFMEKYAQKSNSAGKEPQGKVEENNCIVEDSLGSVNEKLLSNGGTKDSELTPEVGSAPKKKKKKHRSKDLEVAEELAVQSSNDGLNAEVPEVNLQKKKKKHKSKDLEVEKASEISNTTKETSDNLEDTFSIKKKKRKNRDLEDEGIHGKEENFEISMETSENLGDTISKKIKKRKNRQMEDEGIAGKEEIVEISLSRKKKRKDEEGTEDLPNDESQSEKKVKKSKKKKSKDCDM